MISGSSALQGGALRAQFAPDRSKATFNTVHEDKNSSLYVTRAIVKFDHALPNALTTEFDDEARSLTKIAERSNEIAHRRLMAPGFSGTLL